MKKLKNPYLDIEGYHCFGCDPTHDKGLRMEFYEDGDEVVSRWTPNGEYASWLDTVHGGVQATLLDELCGWVVLRKLQSGAVTSRLELRYRKPVHISAGPLTLRGTVKGQRRNIIDVEGRLYDGNGELCTEASCVYFLLPKDAPAAMCGCETEGEELPAF
ncbi:MAG: PaaI family thioesterase [Alistipes sp.]|nr:PaaI family thioesterase [Alistipes sp.]